MMLYRYKDTLFKDEEECFEYIAENEEYLGEEGLMNIVENEIDWIETLEDLLDYCEEECYTIAEVCEFMDIDLRDFINKE